jgi:hypothetical protein
MLSGRKWHVPGAPLIAYKKLSKGFSLDVRSPGRAVIQRYWFQNRHKKRLKYEPI